MRLFSIGVKSGFIVLAEWIRTIADCGLFIYIIKMDNSIMTQRTTYQDPFGNKKWRKRNYLQTNFLNVNKYR